MPIPIQRGRGKGKIFIPPQSGPIDFIAFYTWRLGWRLQGLLLIYLFLACVRCCGGLIFPITVIGWDCNLKYKEANISSALEHWILDKNIFGIPFNFVHVVALPSFQGPILHLFNFSFLDNLIFRYTGKHVPLRLKAIPLSPSTDKSRPSLFAGYQCVWQTALLSVVAALLYFLKSGIWYFDDYNSVSTCYAVL